MLSTYEHRCFELADIPMVFTPQTDLAILNYIANHIIQTGRVNEEFVDKHVNFKRGNAGYRLWAAGPSIRASRRRPTPTIRTARSR